MAGHPDFTKLQKHDTVLQLLANLEYRLGTGTFQIVDHWEGDLGAIGIAHPCNRELLAYVAVYGPDDCYVELEVPPQAGSELPYSVAGEFRSATFDDVAHIVAKHFAATDPQEHPRMPA
jgi:hypothetical protein